MLVRQKGRERVRSPRRLQNRGDFFSEISMLMRQKGCRGIRSPRRLQNRGDFFSKIAMPIGQKCCGGVRSPRRLQNRGVFFAFGESESPRSHAKKAVEKSDPLGVSKIVLHFLRSANANHHAHTPKRLWKDQIRSTFSKWCCIFCVRWKRITTLTRQKGCKKIRSPRVSEVGWHFFAVGENGSPFWRDKKAVGKWIPSRFLAHRIIFWPQP